MYSIQAVLSNLEGNVKYYFSLVESIYPESWAGTEYVELADRLKCMGKSFAVASLSSHSPSSFPSSEW